MIRKGTTQGASLIKKEKGEYDKSGEEATTL